MKRGRYERTSKNSFFVLMVIGCIIGLALVVLPLHSCHQGDSEQLLSTIGTSVVKNPDTIAIPGYEILTLKADSTKQTICLPNPLQNCCYFKITLSLADGTVLWQSDFISPGETSAAITLSKPLPKGTYTGAKLTYQCFQMNEDFTPLNGAETKLTLVVK